MNPTQKSARIAGLLYLFITVTGVFSLMYVPKKLFVRDDAAATASNILAHEMLFRIDVVNSTFSVIGFLFLALALYRLFRDVDQRQATVMVILVLVQIPISFVTEMIQLGALLLVRGGGYLSVFDKAQRNAFAMLFLKMNEQGTYVTEIFWGLWLFPLAVLVYRSRFLPRFLAVWLGINGMAYVVLSVANLLAPQYADLGFKIAFPAMLGELAFTLWLLIMGAKRTPLPAAQPLAVG